MESSAMTDMEWTASLGERMTRLETLFEATLAHQARREDEDARRRREESKERRRREEATMKERRELAGCLQAMAARLDAFEPVILGDAGLGQISLAERIEALERVVLSARVGWRTAAYLTTGLIGLLSALAYLMHWAPGLDWRGAP